MTSLWYWNHRVFSSVQLSACAPHGFRNFNSNSKLHTCFLLVIYIDVLMISDLNVNESQYVVIFLTYSYAYTYKTSKRCMIRGTHLAPLLLMWFNFNPSMDNNHMPSKMWHDFTYPFPNFNGYTVEVWEGISNSIPHFMLGVIIFFSCWDWRSTMLIKRGRC